MKNLIRHLRKKIDTLTTLDGEGTWSQDNEEFYSGLDVAKIVNESERLAAACGAEIGDSHVSLIPREGLTILGRLLTWAQAQSAPDLLTVDAVASIVGVSSRTIWRRVSAGEFPAPIQLGGLTKWRRSEVEMITNG
jgi:predicted DNA-binding transcriptional regulator AlpA